MSTISGKRAVPQKAEEQKGQGPTAEGDQAPSTEATEGASKDTKKTKASKDETKDAEEGEVVG